jgi:hypothetical protein
MVRRDEIDAALAKHFAWRFVPPAETARVEEALRAAEAAEGRGDESPSPAAVDEETAVEDERLEAQARAACEPLAIAVAEAWAEADADKQVALVKRLIARAARLAFKLHGFLGWPLEAVRLLRLVVRCSPRLTRKQRERALDFAPLMPLDHDEAAELLVEVARAGDGEMGDALFDDDGSGPDVGDEEAFVARLADVVDDGPTHRARCVAVDVIDRFSARGPAAAALRRALRLPSFAVRARALRALATAEPCLVTADDLVHVLQDLVAHAPPDPFSGEEQEYDERVFAEAVLAALHHVQPEAAGEALLDWIDAEQDTMWLDAGWATEALSVGFAETGAAMVDHWLKCARGYDRAKAIAALSRLPDALAEPRLRRAASDPATHVREAAGREWMERFGAPIVVPPGELVGGHLLQGPVSDRFASRLSVLHGRVADARRAMARAILAEAPDREALVLLLQLVGDDSESGEPASFGRDSEWGPLLVQRFGAAGVEGLCALAERYSEPESFAWNRRLGDLVDSGVIPLEHAKPLRELATRHVLSEDAGQVDDSLRLLALVGAPSELLDRVMALALGDDVGAWEARKLIVAWPDRSGDTRLTSDMALALAERDWRRLENAAWMALERGAAAAQVIAQRVLEVVEEDEEALDAAVACARGLRSAGILDDAWAKAALGRPQSRSFTVVTRAWRGAASLRPELEAALVSPARGGCAAAEAAIALLAGEPPWNVRDRRLAAVLAAAPLQERAELVSIMCLRGCPFSMVAPHLEPLLTSADELVTETMRGMVSWLKSRKLHAILRQVLPRVVDHELRAEIEEQLGEQPPSYWAP